MQLVKTAQGQQAFKERSHSLTQRQRSAFLLFDGQRSIDEVLAATAVMGITRDDVQAMVEQGLLAPTAGQAATAEPASDLPASAAERSPKERYQDAYPIATELTGALGLKGFRLNLAVEGSSGFDDLVALAPRIREAVGEENFYLFGLTTPEVERMLAEGSYDPWEYYRKHPEIRRVLDSISAGRFSPDEPTAFHWIFEKLLAKNERYLHLADFMSYIEGHERIGMEYARPDVWMRKAVLNTARMGYFSSDRTIREYAKDIWGIKPIAPRGA